MIFLRYLALGGFKSFRDWSLLELSPNVNVVVGGNGTGKTSVVEALLWCLGESDLVSLRARDKADLLFRPPAHTGLKPDRGETEQHLIFTHRVEERAAEERTTRERESAAAAEAQVYLVLGDDADLACDDAGTEGDGCCCKSRAEQRSQLPDGVASVGRRLTCDGEEEWLVDATPASAETVARALAPHGLDRAAVSVIRQGELERILLAGPVLRARILAEMAGLTPEDDVLVPFAASGADEGAETAALLVQEWLQREGIDSTPLGGPHRLLQLLGLADGGNGAKRGGDRDSHAPEEQPAGPWRSLQEAHRRVEARFRRLFRRLVPEGEVELPLTLPDASSAAPAGMPEPPGPGSPTLDIRVHFPGFGWGRVDGLSGGQRALVAFALGLALFLESPARLLVLDEVEPALDEGNLRRFNDLLHEVAEDRQVIVISHQRRTKDVGDVVFGIDHGGFGASTLHFRFEPATRKLVVFGRVRGNWLERSEALGMDGDLRLGGAVTSPGLPLEGGGCC